MTTTTNAGAIPDHEVVVIGAGFSGIGTGIKLKDEGIDDFVILEQSGEVGGTWRDNTYPGVAVDVTSFTYSFSFEPNPNWSRAYAPGHELRAYAEHCTDKYGIRPYIRFNTRVTKLVFDERDSLWRIHTNRRKAITARFVIAGPGGLTQPKLPDIDGIDDFAGKVMHTARWDHDHDLTGQRVAIIGTGATAVQVVPSIAREVQRLDVYQRTPIWIAPKVDPPIPRPLRTLFRHIPSTQASLRMTTTALTEAVMVLAVTYNRELPLLVRGIERLCREHLRQQVPDKELRAKLTPRYGFGCKRPSFSNAYLSSFMRENVELVTDSIERITPTGIRTVDGAEREIDTLILATGFKVFERGNTPPFDIVGVRGLELGEFWEEERYQAYQGVSVPQFPNIFTILGPYGFTGANYFQLIETQSTHALRVIKEARKRRADYVAVRQEVHDRFFAQVLKRRRSQVFFNNGCESSNSYYFDKHGDAPLVRPSSGIEAWLSSRFFNLDAYEYRAAAIGEEREPALAEAV